MAIFVTYALTSLFWTPLMPLAARPDSAPFATMPFSVSTIRAAATRPNRSPSKEGSGFAPSSSSASTGRTLAVAVGLGYLIGKVGVTTGVSTSTKTVPSGSPTMPVACPGAAT